MTQRKRSQRDKFGFTLIEILIVLAIMVTLGLTSLLLFSKQRNLADLTGAEQQVVAMVREAQSRSASQYENVSWGVHFANSTATAPFYALFYSSYATTTAVAHYRLPPSVAYVTSTLAVGATQDITFAEISGTASASTSIGLRSASQPNLAPVTISVASSGEVGF